MAKTRALVKRRKAIRNIRKITRTMELIATARFKKAMDRAVEADAYTKKIAELVADLGKSGSENATHPLLADRPEPKKGIVLVLSSNRGLCGGYNANVLKTLMRAIDPANLKFSAELEISGKRGIAFAKYRNLTPTKTFTHFEDKPGFDEVEVLADRYAQMFVKGEIDRLDVVYTRFISAGKQFAMVETILPMKNLADSTDNSEAKGVASGSETGPEFEFAPSATTILNEIVPVSFKVRLFKTFLDAAVSEQIARMVAMKSATENAAGLIKDLSRKYNRARQSQITSEISEIIGTVEALK